MQWDAQAQPEPAGEKRILLVEDEPGMRDALALALRLEQYIVTSASNGREACLLYAPGDFDLVITDYAMPEMKGDELARTLKCLVPSQPILMLTAYAHLRCGPENPVDVVLEKPFTWASLRQMIAALLRSRGRAQVRQEQCSRNRQVV